MSQPLLSILIPTVFGREESRQRLESKILAITDWRVQVLVISDNKEMTIGAKREKLYAKAEGLYSWQIDDDDDVANNSFDWILKLIHDQPDCITFQEKCMMNGNYYRSNHSLSYEDWNGDGNSLLFDGFHFHRTPFYKDIIRTDIARSVPFEHIRYGEDHAWSRALKPHLRNEVHIDEEIYFYIHNSKPEDHNTRYGYDRH